jgi:hypothetical protein
VPAAAILWYKREDLRGLLATALMPAMFFTIGQ